MTPTPSPLAAALTIELFIPGVLENPSNASGWTWPRRALWALTWRNNTRASWLVAGRPTKEGRCVFTFTGYVRRLFDDDNFPLCVKPARDEITKLMCGTDDSPKSGHVFQYAQETGHAERGVLIRVEPGR